MKPTVLNLVSKSLLTETQRQGSAHPINTGFTACHPLPGRVSHLPPPPFLDLQSSGQLILPLATALLLSRCHPLYYANYSCVIHITALLLSSLKTRQVHILMAKSMSYVSQTRSTQSSCSQMEKESAWHGSSPVFPC